jgi:PleD family two-component response regulator
MHADAWARTVLTDLLASASWDTRQAWNGATAARLALELHPRLIVVGPRLSEVCPRELTSVLQSDARTRAIPVILSAV